MGTYLFRILRFTLLQRLPEILDLVFFRALQRILDIYPPSSTTDF